MTTGTEPVEELEVPNLKERLWQELSELHAEQQRSSITAGATGNDLVRLRSRRSLRLAGIGAAAAAVLLAGALTALGPGGDGSHGGVLMERIAAATDNALAESVVHGVEEQVAPDGQVRRFEHWHDETTGIARILDLDAAGNPVLDVGPLTGPTMDSPHYSGQRVVDYCARGYIEHVDTGGADTNIGAGVPDLRTLIAEGELVEDGTEVFDGRELIRLRGTDTEGGSFVLLVDPDTYRVVAQRGRFAGGAGESYTTVYEYLPRTAESLELLHPPIPEGFTQAGPGGLSSNLDSCS